MQATAKMIVNAMKSGYYDQVTTILSAAGTACSTFSIELTVDMCKEVDRVLKVICEAAKENGYTLIAVGTHAEATHVRENDEEPVVCNNVPCVIVPPAGVKYERQTRWVDGGV